MVRVATTGYVALLRGVNVGGRNKVGMGELRDAFEAAGYSSVSTYIQSGNVVFDSDAPPDLLEASIEATLERRFGFPIVVVVRSDAQLASVIGDAPDGFGHDSERFLWDAIFLKTPLSSEAAMRVVEQREGVDQAWPGTGVLYFSRLRERRTQSRMSRIVGTPEYRQMTIRSWSTTTKLGSLLDARRDG